MEMMQMLDPGGSLSETERRALLMEASERSILYLADVNARPVACSAEALERLAALRQPLPKGSTDPIEVLRILDQVGSPATIVTAGCRYSGLVIGGALPVTVAANWLATAWDQNAVFQWTSPIAATLEDVCLAWLGEKFQLPAGFGGAFVSGATMGSTVALTAAQSAEVVELATIAHLTKSASRTIASKSFFSALVLRSGGPRR
jgi:hypothetical protein